jgi:hypothetical protein
MGICSVSSNKVKITGCLVTGIFLLKNNGYLLKEAKKKKKIDGIN